MAKEKAAVRPFLSFFFLAFDLVLASACCFFFRFLEVSLAARAVAAASSPLSLSSFSLLSSPSPLLAASSSSFPPLL